MFKGSNVALVTPFKDNKLDEESYIKLINFHLENFKKQQSSEDLNTRLQSRDKVPATQQYSLNKTEHLPIRENLPLSYQDNYVYKPQ